MTVEEFEKLPFSLVPDWKLADFRKVNFENLVFPTALTRRDEADGAHCRWLIARLRDGGTVEVGDWSSPVFEEKKINF
jgi:hypothetical protein